MRRSNTKIFTLTLVLMDSIFWAALQTTPQERCAGEGDRVCLDCFRQGTCVDNGDGTFSFDNIIMCPTSPMAYCDDTLFSSGSYGQCSPLPPSYTNCSCSSIKKCVADPNNPSTILHCESDPPVTDPPCSVPALDLTTCTCMSCSDTCPFIDDPNDDCEKYYFCDGHEFIASECPPSLCFDQAECQCRDTSSTIMSTTPTPSATNRQSTVPTASTKLTTSTTFTTPTMSTNPTTFTEPITSIKPTTSTAPLTSTEPATSTSFTKLTKSTTSITSTIFTTIMSTEPITSTTNTASAETTTYTSTISTTTANPTTSSSSASSTTYTEPTTFPMPTTPTTTTSPTTTTTPTTTSTLTPSTTPKSLTCPPGCPYVDDPYSNNCQKYYICDGDYLISRTCQGTSCFDQANCRCQ